MKSQNDKTQQTRSLKDLINTPFKKIMLIVQLISYVLIPGSPIIGGLIAKILNLTTKQAGGLILGIFILGEILFYVSLFFLGKEVIKLLRDKIKARFKNKSNFKPESEDRKNRQTQT